MILTALILMGIFIVDTILLIFPSSSGFPVQVDTAITSISGYVGILSPILPLSTMSQILALIIIYELSIFGFKAFKWLFSYIPFIGGK